MNDKPLITVIIPSYNSPDIYATLDSVLEQDYPKIQLILVDDGSLSFSKEDVEYHIKSNAKSNIEEVQVLVNPDNRGTVYTMNVGFSHSCGEYLFNLASDDCFYDPYVLSDWVDEFLKTGAHVITAYRAVYDDQLINFKKIEPNECDVQKIKTFQPKQLFEDLAGANYIFGCCTARSAECIEKYGLFDERYRLIEDHSMNLKLLRMGEKIHFYDRIVVKYREGGTSSPLQYNPIYEKDVNLILTEEVLPFTEKPLNMKWKYYLWKREQSLLRRRACLADKYGNGFFQTSFIMIWYYSHHPIRVSRSILRRIVKSKEI